MADDQPNPFASKQNAPNHPADDPKTPDPTPKEPESDDPPNADPAVKSVLAKERKAARDATARATAAEAKLQEIADKDKGELQRATERAEKAEREAGQATTRALRLEVAADKGLSAALAARLQGSTREELESDATELLKLTGAGTPARRDPDQGRGDTDPAKDGGMSAWMRRSVH